MALPGFPDAMPLEGLLGGAMIGIAALIMLLGAGRIMGASGLVSRAVGLGGSSLGMLPTWGFVIGIMVGAYATSLLVGAPEIFFSSPWIIGIAGLLVGFGARYGSGCTSGHGVCGMSRLSQRSIVATVTFMAAGMATVALMNAAGIEVLR